jgi:hypothetical protein
MSQSAWTVGPADDFNGANSDFLRRAFRITEPTASLVHCGDGSRLVKAFLRIRACLQLRRMAAQAR